MASLLDSEAQFRQRARECKLSDAAFRDLARTGVNSFGLLAYSFGQPGQNIDDGAFNTWIRTEINAAISLADGAALKRLLFEAHTLVLASLKEQVVAPDAHASRKVPPTERDSKMQLVKDTLTGLLIEGPLDPGHSLLDACAQIHFANELKYLAPERCISRNHEITHQKSPAKQVEIESDRLIVKEKSEVPDEAAHSALQVKEALERRGIGLVFADVVTYTCYSKYLTSLFAHMHREPPSGYARTSVTQIVNADKAVWAKLLEAGRQASQRSSRRFGLRYTVAESLRILCSFFHTAALAAAEEKSSCSSCSQAKTFGKESLFQQD
eukprot:s605_g21.t1